MNKKTKRGIILTSLASIAFAGSLLAGSTYALFTSESTTNIAVSSGTVDVVATIDESSLVTYSGVDLTGNADSDTLKETETKGKFTTGGTATINADGDLELENVAPGDKVTFNIKVTNKSNILVNYRTKVNFVEDNCLSDALKITIGEQSFNRKIVTSYKSLAVGSSEETIPVTVEMPSSAGSEYQGLSCKISYTVEAIQGNAATSNDSYPYVYPEGVTDDSFTEGNTLAYVDSNDEVKYSSDFRALVEDASVSTIYCKAGSNFTGISAHCPFDRDLTIYGNNSNFNYADISMNSLTANGTKNINIYDTNNLAIWGDNMADGITLNVYMEGCTMTGEESKDHPDSRYLFHQKGKEETCQRTINATFKYCKVKNAEYAYSASTLGESTFENCVFRDCYMGVKTKLKATSEDGTRTDTIKNCLFVNCGTTIKDEKVSKYYAPISYSNDYDGGKFKGKLTLNSINNTFYNSLGENGDILLGDNRTGETFNTMTLNLTCKDTVTVRKAHSTIDEYLAGTYEITCPADLGQQQ